MKRFWLLSVPLLVWAQAAPESDKSVSLSKVERKSRAPVSKEVLSVKLPKPVEFKLDNGLTVLLLENHKLPYVSVNLVVEGAGPVSEPADQPGLASATAQMLDEGTATRSSQQIAEEVDRYGAILRANSNFGTIDASVFASGLSQTFDKWFPIVADVLLHPAFPPHEFKVFQQRAMASLRQQRSSPQFLATERFSHAVYGTFPAAIVAPSAASLEAMTPAVLKKWHDERYVPQNAILGVAGDMTAAQLKPILNRNLAEWKKTEFSNKLPPNPTAVAQKQVYLVNRPGSVQTNIVIGNLAIDRRNPDYIAMRVLNQVLGGGPSSRLFMKLREEKGYTYGAYSTFTASQFTGPWRATSEVRTEVTQGSLTEFFNELGRIRNDAVPVAELDDARRTIVAQFALSLERPEQVLELAITRKRYGLPEDYWDTYPSKVSAVSAEDLQHVAKKYIDLDKVQIVAVGDAAKIKSVLDQYGPVSVYDAEGKQITN
jgi:zinc protease